MLSRSKLALLCLQIIVVCGLGSVESLAQTYVASMRHTLPDSTYLPWQFASDKGWVTVGEPVRQIEELSSAKPTDQAGYWQQDEFVLKSGSDPVNKTSFFYLFRMDTRTGNVWYVDSYHLPAGKAWRFVTGSPVQQGGRGAYSFKIEEASDIGLVIARRDKANGRWTSTDGGPWTAESNGSGGTNVTGGPTGRPITRLGIAVKAVKVVEITEVAANSPALQCVGEDGKIYKLERGDILRKFNGALIGSLSELTDAVRKAPQNVPIEVMNTRTGMIGRMTLDLSGQVNFGAGWVERLGLTANGIVMGFEITKIDANSPVNQCISSDGRTLRLEIGDVIGRFNNKLPGSINGFADMVRMAPKSSSLEVVNFRTGRSNLMTVTLIGTTSKPNTNPGTPKLPSIAGRWRCSCGQTWTLKQNGGQITGTETRFGGLNPVVGTFDGKEFVFRYDDRGRGDRGVGVFTLSSSRKTMSGRIDWPARPASTPTLTFLGKN